MRPCGILQLLSTKARRRGSFYIGLHAAPTACLDRLQESDGC